jgi:hypothetical protein
MSPGEKNNRSIKSLNWKDRAKALNYEERDEAGQTQ